jgi:large subunit ribosomal protein L6
MSRIGKKPVVIPNGIDVSVNGSVLTAKKSNIIKEIDVFDRVVLSVKDGKVVLDSKGETKSDKAFWGTYRALISNIFEGIDKGFEKKLEINGVGYRAAVQGKELVLQLGFSHPVNFPIPEGISIEVEKETKLTINGNEKQVVGQVAAEIRAFRPPEPYKGKGIKYADEHIVRKAGKTAKK